MSVTCYATAADGRKVKMRQRTGQTLLVVGALEDGPGAVVVGGQTPSDLGAGFVTYNAALQLHKAGWMSHPDDDGPLTLTAAGRALVATLRHVDPIPGPPADLAR